MGRRICRNLVIKYIDTQVGEKKGNTNPGEKNNLYRKRHHETVQSSVRITYTVMIM